MRYCPHCNDRLHHESVTHRIFGCLYCAAMLSYGAQGSCPTTHLPHPTCYEAKGLGPTCLIPPMGLLSPSLDEFHFSACSRMLYCKFQHACSSLLLITLRSNSHGQPRLPKLSLPPVSGHHPAIAKPCSQSSAARRSLFKPCESVLSASLPPTWPTPANSHGVCVRKPELVILRLVFLSPCFLDITAVDSTTVERNDLFIKGKT